MNPTTPLMPSQSECTSYACGADPSNNAGRFACAYYGMAQALPCIDPRCAPYCPDQQILTAAQQQPASQPASIQVLTPQSILPAIPTVTLQPTPVVITCDWWSELNGNIEQNPLIAAGVLILVAVAVSQRKGRR